MIVCICHSVSDRDITRAAEAGTASFEALKAQTQLGSNCGRCIGCAREIFEDACARRRSPALQRGPGGFSAGALAAGG